MFNREKIIYELCDIITIEQFLQTYSSIKGIIFNRIMSALPQDVILDDTKSIFI